MNAKKIAAERAVDYIKDGMIVGLGTGSTAYWAIEKIGAKVREGLNIKAVATSLRSEEQARKLGIKLIPFSEIDKIDITIDGADEVDQDLNLIKGGGGALLREKIVAAASRQLIIVVDESKMVDKLGAFPLPVEMVKFGYEITVRKLQSLGCEPVLRKVDNDTYITDNGNFIVDCHFKRIDNPSELHNKINMIPGVVDNGLFINMAAKVIIGYNNGDIKELI
ncbi:ribose-5-phosphate isomerase [Herbinix hemicellulosilytica]|uniref:Ribose-5-phosphate isomerase A n=1 Tax=Herbinix hemicellulosilytica TaxID=1564487 RepID=A0A0H5SI70_HERHM|nr:ribose-5-phosphate isomerase RpiA [Herbinix hemicellulosilytica]RBP57297.1 ribose-5-phosphate isomerase [Herbinix hemicellulosilytica]CRZ34785.1 Ribose-5-phosphate isomerase A [Herbinix hemicellulosilytica]